MTFSKIKKHLTRSLKVLVLSILSLALLTSCTNPLASLLTGKSQTQLSFPQAEVVFQVVLPAALPENNSLYLEIVDDVTGIALNPVRYAMTQQDERTYYVKVVLTVGSVVKYRYSRVSDASIVEFTPQGNQVRYRLAKISGPAIVQDSIAAWIDQPYTGAIGRVRGQFIDSANNAPIPGLLVTAEGLQTITASDGTFILEGLTPGTHTLIAYSTDGTYETFSQGVTIAEEATTPVFVNLTQRKTITVTLNVSFPDNFSTLLPARIASNDSALGNSYTDLYSGSTALAANLPQLSKINEHRYQVKLTLPVGYDFRYKYTLGDGFWNSELGQDGQFVLRQLIVPEHDLTINDVVHTFTTPSEGTVSFLVTADALPAGEEVSIQMNPFGWFAPLPMTKISDTQWLFTLYSPLNYFSAIQYRYCRNDLCESTQAVGTDQLAFTVNPDSQTFPFEITGWKNYSVATSPTVVVTDGGNISIRPDFMAGFEVSSQYSPLYDHYLASGLQKIAYTGSSDVVLSPTWTATRNSPPYLEPLPGKDVSWTQMQTEIITAKQLGLNVSLFPVLNYPNGAAQYWGTASKDAGWWTSWYDRYHRYMMQVADWANLTGVKSIILGDPSVSPSMGNGTLADGSTANAPANADDQWRQLVQDIRSRFSGTILGVVTAPGVQTLPVWLDSVDGIYVLYSPALSQTSNPSVNDLEALFQSDLEQNLHPRLSTLNKPVILALNYPSASNAFAGCTDVLGSCLGNWGNDQLDFVPQTSIYNAAIIVAGKETWINGFIARGTQPVATVMDSSTSVLSKPANDALWFWYYYILNKSPQ